MTEFAKLAFFALAFVLLQAPSGDFKILPTVVRIKLDPQPDYEKTMREGGEQVGAQLECSSGYRDEGQQRTACESACKGKTPPGKEGDGCPGFCARPGNSNHQWVATCDIQKIPGDVKKGCDFLFEMCQKMRSRDNSLQCEIGGYGPGAHHLAVGRGIKPSAYNQCKHLKPKMGMDPGRDQRLQNDANNLQNEIMGNNRPLEQPQLQPSAASPSAMHPAASNSPPASYPTPYRGDPTASPLASRNPAAEVGRGNPGTGRGQVEINIKPSAENGYSDVTNRKPGELNGPSGISGGGRDELPGTSQAGGGLANDGVSGNARGFRERSGAVPGSLGSSAPLGDSAVLAGKPGNADGNNPYASGATAAGEVLSSYSGSGGGGGKLSSSKVSVAGSDVAAAVDNLAQDLVGSPGAGVPLAREEAASIGTSDSKSLFDRAQEAHLRCQRRGCVSRAR